MSNEPTPPPTTTEAEQEAVNALQSLCDGLQAQLERKEKEIEVERALKWIHFENAAKFDAEVRELKRHIKDSELDAVLVDEVQRRMDAVVDAAVAWHQSGNEGVTEEYMGRHDTLEDAVESLLELRTGGSECSG